MTVRTCTKVNVGLNVLRRRPDGYHDLETLFVPYYGYSDLLTIEPAEHLGITIEREGGVDWDPMQDLTVRAWRLLKADFPQLPEVSIHLEKHSPVGAGLGGGSADAAFMLRALNDLAGLGLDSEALASYASRLGSDCSFFIKMRKLPSSPVADAPDLYQPMFASGRGEILEPFDIDLSGYTLKVEIPTDSAGNPVSVSTREAYGGIVPREPSLRLRETLQLPVEEWRGKVVNDFESTVCPLHPEIPALIDDFYARGAVYAAMSGSGSSVFGLFK
ncbi:MAG: 4-(cytidine 5'-diphospho)-2-C-methyl-D-erythritol kinase [Bacteroidales bacterium]|nr:4-(cytidine 5'-diphospho)-2-C-methyl-D-erythritol kinase [Bacteroidales bacterium]